MRFRSSSVLGVAGLAAAAVALVPVAAGVSGAAEGAGAGDTGRALHGPAAPREADPSAPRDPAVRGDSSIRRDSTVRRGDSAVRRRDSAVRPDADRPDVANRPTCAADDSTDFPIDTRIHRGPGTYRPGEGYRDWTIDLTNTTDESCGNVHPILVLVDRTRTLKPEQVQLEFHDGTRGRPVRFEKTGQGENIGVFDDGFPGFTVAPGRTVGVKVRLTFTSDTEADHVVATAALVQRREDDGDWVGESNAYAFDVEPDGPATPTAEQLAQTGPGTPLALGIAAGAVLLGAGAIVMTTRRKRTTRG
ncbi:LPXTG cell wall anchor domain-containing protein [Streptomyces sp. NPDC048518]|uniref:LPXTG cell wall anchor domain-containing protein n=1 Tax=Streptomyces sp. NPDC048518 TaxID=3155029 RepID=UPI0034072192